MAHIWFFCIPAHGHTNPTLPVAAELCRRGHAVRYYSFPPFAEKITAAGAEFVDCAGYLPPQPDDLEKKVGRDLSALLGMVADTALTMQGRIAADMAAGPPDLIVSDSVCHWGRLFAQKYGVPFVCSTTTFAYNRYTAGLMRQTGREALAFALSVPRLNGIARRLRRAGYPVHSFVDMIANDETTDTVVYTSREFQPRAETFGANYAFVGPSLAVPPPDPAPKTRPLVYVSLGTVLNRQPDFYRQCFAALGGLDADILVSAGESTDIAALGTPPANFTLRPRVGQLRVLQRADVFVTHCGMNSVSESLYFGVPTVLWPLTAEERAVADRTAELGAGKLLKKADAGSIRAAVETLLTEESFRRAARALGEGLRRSGGAQAAADFIESRLPR